MYTKTYLVRLGELYKVSKTRSLSIKERIMKENEMNNFQYINNHTPTNSNYEQPENKERTPSRQLGTQILEKDFEVDDLELLSEEIIAVDFSKMGRKVNAEKTGATPEHTGLNLDGLDFMVKQFGRNPIVSISETDYISNIEHTVGTNIYLKLSLNTQKSKNVQISNICSSAYKLIPQRKYHSSTRLGKYKEQEDLPTNVSTQAPRGKLRKNIYVRELRGNGGQGTLYANGGGSVLGKTRPESKKSKFDRIVVKRICLQEGGEEEIIRELATEGGYNNTNIPYNGD